MIEDIHKSTPTLVMSRKTGICNDGQWIVIQKKRERKKKYYTYP
jgi:hypothetical protein